MNNRKTCSTLTLKKKLNEASLFILNGVDSLLSCFCPNFTLFLSADIAEEKQQRNE
jgi:hypothetical protein